MINREQGPIPQDILDNNQDKIATDNPNSRFTGITKLPTPEEFVVDLKELSKEESFTVWKNILLNSPKPSLVLEKAIEMSDFKEKYPVFAKLKETPQEHEWHPEGDVLIHTMMVLDKAAEIIQRENLSEEESLIIMLSALCHDLGKPSTTEFIDGRIRSRGHEAAGAKPTSEFLEAININQENNPAHQKIVELVKEHMRPNLLYKDEVQKNRPVSNSTIRRLAQRISPASIEELALLAEADIMGRGPFLDPETGQLAMPSKFPAGPWLVGRAKAIGVNEAGPYLLNG